MSPPTSSQRKRMIRQSNATIRQMRELHLSPEEISRREEKEQGAKSLKRRNARNGYGYTKAVWKGMSKQVKAQIRKEVQTTRKDERAVLKQKDKACNRKHGGHVFVASATELLEICCINCGKPAFRNLTDTYETRILKYLSSRRKRRHLENLYSLVVPLHNNTKFLQLLRTIIQNGIYSNTSSLHVTLLEGVCPNTHFPLSLVRNMLHNNPGLTIVNFRTIPTVTPNKLLVLAVVQLQSTPLNDFLRLGDQNSSNHCATSTITTTTTTTTTTFVTRLPQWDHHIALGLIPALDATQILDRLRNALLLPAASTEQRCGGGLRVSPELLALLPCHHHHHQQELFQQQHQQKQPQHPPQTTTTAMVGKKW